jgi:hypothetical protein
MKAPHTIVKPKSIPASVGAKAAKQGFSISDEILSSLDAIRQHIINNGHIAHEGSAQEIKARPQILHRHLGV